MSIVSVEYIWIDAHSQLRSKVRTLTNLETTTVGLKDIPEWNFDGTSTGQSLAASKSEIILKPQSLYPNPLIDTVVSYLVLCDCYDTDNQPTSCNHRQAAESIFADPKVSQSDIWFGLEQEYVLYNPKTNRLLGWPDGPTSFPEKQGKYYCGLGVINSPGRQIAEEHYLACLRAKLQIAGFNEEVLPGQWEYQIGICKNITASDQLWISRYLLHRIAQKYNVAVSFDPKPVAGDWNGTGLHHNVSTQAMREDGGILEIHAAIYKLSVKHSEHLEVYGNNSQRLVGALETSAFDKFSYGVGDRSASVRIPNLVYHNSCGYFEDRRVAGDADPYLSTAVIAKTIILD